MLRYHLLTASRKNGVWLSLVERYVRDVEVAGSNPVTPTNDEGILEEGFLFLLLRDSSRPKKSDTPMFRRFALSFYARFFFFFFASGRKTVTLPIKQIICTRMTPTVTPMLSIATSRFDGPRPATKD